MQLIVNSTDTTETLFVAYNTIVHLLHFRKDLPEGFAFEEIRGPVLVRKDQQQEPPTPVAVTTGNVAEPTPAPKPAAKAKSKVVKTVTADEVRLVMVEKAKAGKDQAIRDLLQDSFGVPKLSMVPPERLVELKTAVEAL